MRSKNEQAESGQGIDNTPIDTIVPANGHVDMAVDPMAELEALDRDVKKSDERVAAWYDFLVPDNSALPKSIEKKIDAALPPSIVLENIYAPEMLADKDALKASSVGLKDAARVSQKSSYSQFETYKNPQTIIERLGQERLSFIKYLSETSGIPAAVIASIMVIESGGNPNLMSYGGAAGRFQHVKATARSMKVGGGREVVTYRAGEVDDKRKVVQVGSKDYTIGREGDYKDSEGKYYPVEDGRFGFEHWAGTVNILYGCYKAAGDSWLEAPRHYHGDEGPVERYIAQFAYVVQGASDINWSLLPAYQPKHEVHEVKEPINLYDLLYSDEEYSILDFVDDSDPNASLNNQLSLFRVPLGALSSDLKIPEDNVNKYFLSRKLEKRLILSDHWVGYDDSSFFEIIVGNEKGPTGFYHQAKNGVGATDVYTKNSDGTVTINRDAFRYDQADIDAWRGVGDFYDEETSVDPEFTWQRRGVNHPPTIDDLRRSGISFREIIQLNPDVFGVGQGGVTTMDPAIKRYLQTTYLRPGYLLEIKVGKAKGTKGGTEKMEQAKKGPTEGEILADRNTDSEVKGYIAKSMFKKKKEGDRVYHMIRLASELNSFVMKYHIDSATKTLLEETVEYCRNLSSDQDLLTTLASNPSLMRSWLDLFLYKNVEEMMSRKSELTVDEVEFFMMTVKVYQGLIGNYKSAFKLLPSFWKQYKQMIAWHGELVKIEGDKQGTQAKIDEAKAAKRYADIAAIKLRESYREANEIVVVQTLLNDEDVKKEIGLLETREFANQALVKIQEELKKFSAIGLSASVKEIVEVGDGSPTGEISIPIEITDQTSKTGKSMIAKATFNKKNGLKKFDLYSMVPSEGFDLDSMYTERYDEGSNAQLERIDVENINDMLFGYLMYRLVHTPEKKKQSTESGLREGMVEYGGSTKYKIFTTEYNSSVYVGLINPSTITTFNSEEYVGAFYINVYESLDDDAEMDGNFITLTTKRWEVVDGKMVRASDAEGKRLPEIVLGRFKSVDDLIMAINSANIIDGYSTENKKDFIKRPIVTK
ncbi:MAG: hypothetical protein Q8P68_03560 [Candidatus Peregrinibacteria bacterium]|nr:hypothetical protein [Candidatus Peregrinibacteria bacterium]MDZ4245322.1 hypothetical protein [Candidatus Gracilibacteria bacterium]